MVWCHKINTILISNQLIRFTNLILQNGGLYLHNGVLDATIFWAQYSATEVEIYGREYTQVVAPCSIDHDIYVNALYTSRFGIFFWSTIEK